ncbi:MAG: competence/damage-inducible protein A [Turicibacter sp.]|nr:competence/damage-inducible protein A [Turicibacter sp.]
MKVAILAIGNEVLCGKTINTNSTFIAKEVELLGGELVHQQVVLDQVDEIVRGLEIAYTYADLVITIGGLGPTVDDVSREGVAKYFKTDLVYDELIYEKICDYFHRSGRKIPSNNRRQAYKFKDGDVLPNHNGTAPGLFLSQDNKSVFLLPGPPAELEPMFLECVTPYLTSHLTERKVSQSYRLCGIGESYAEEMILSLYERYPHLNIAPYCAPDRVDYIVSTIEVYESELNAFDVEFKELMKDYYIGDQETTLEKEIIRLLKEKGLTIATAESCSGGLLSSTLVNVVGASSVFLEGIVTYSYESKSRLLNINKERLEAFGAVSKEIASDMANNLKELSGADLTISITGIAGPDGGSEVKPVGLVYMAFNVCGQNFLKSYIFNGNREKIRQRTVAESLYWIYRYIKAL